MPGRVSPRALWPGSTAAGEGRAPADGGQRARIRQRPPEPGRSEIPAGLLERAQPCIAQAGHGSMSPFPSRSIPNREFRHAGNHPPDQPGRCRGPPVVGHAHGLQRRAARFRHCAAQLARPPPGQPLAGPARRARHHRPAAEQHRHQPDGSVLHCQWHPGPGAGAGSDARRQRRHHPGGATAQLRHLVAGAAGPAVRPAAVPPGRRSTPGEPWPVPDRTRPDAPGAGVARPFCSRSRPRQPLSR